MTAPLRPPDALRRAVAADLRPVRPLPSPARRALLVAAWVPPAVAAVLVLLGMRPDLAALGWPLTLGAVALEAAIGVALVALALAEAVPARGAARVLETGALGAAAVAFAAVAAAVRTASAGMTVPDPLVTHGPSCFAFQVLVGAPALTLVAFLVARAAPLRAAWAGTIGGAGAGFLADGVYHLHCPITDLRHVVVWHGAAVLVLALVGLAAGLAWERAQSARIAARAASRRRPG